MHIPWKHIIDGVRDGNLIDALSELVEAWRVAPTDEIALLVEAVAVEVDRSLAAIPGKPKTDDLHSNWLDIAMARRPADVGRLLARLEDASIWMLAKWIDELLQFPVDPRLPLPVLQAAIRYSSHEASGVRTRAFKLASRVGDRRLIKELPLLAAHVEKWTNALGPKVLGLLDTLQVRLSANELVSSRDVVDSAGTEELKAAVAERALMPAVSETALNASVASKEPPALASELVSDITRNPGDDGVRLVYADYLSDNGDPRGEFIVLQCQDHNKALPKKLGKRMKELAKEFASQWIHPLDAVVRDPRFSRGFLSECSVHFSAERHIELMAHPSWATVEVIHACNNAEFFSSLALSSLRRAYLGSAPLAKMAAISNRSPLESATVEVRNESHQGADWQAILDVGALKALTHLHLRYPEPTSAWGQHPPEREEASDFSWLLESPLARRLRVLRIFNGWTGSALASWLAVFDTLPILEELAVTFTPADYYNSPNYSYPKKPCLVTWELKRHEGHCKLTLRVDWPFHKDALRPIAAGLIQSLQGFPIDEIPQVLVVADGRKWTKAKRQQGLPVVAEVLQPYFTEVLVDI